MSEPCHRGVTMVLLGRELGDIVEAEIKAQGLKEAQCRSSSRLGELGGRQAGAEGKPGEAS